MNRIFSFKLLGLLNIITQIMFCNIYNLIGVEIPANWIELWSQAKPKECFSLPEKNKFLTTNFDILDLSNTVVPTYPEKIVDSNVVELWYKPDNKFKLPNAFMYYYFISPMAQESALK